MRHLIKDWNDSLFSIILAFKLCFKVLFSQILSQGLHNRCSKPSFLRVLMIIFPAITMLFCLPSRNFFKCTSISSKISIVCTKQCFYTLSLFFWVFEDLPLYMIPINIHFIRRCGRALNYYDLTHNRCNLCSPLDFNSRV